MNFAKKVFLCCFIFLGYTYGNEGQTQKSTQSAIDLGCEFLLNDQNDDGSWGSAQQTKGLNIYAPIPGAHRAFRLAVTALAVSALTEAKGFEPNYQVCIEKGAHYLISELPKLRRATPRAIYNVWSHAYGLQAISRLYDLNSTALNYSELKEVMIQQVKMLEKYESIDGGWGYYDFRSTNQTTIRIFYIFR